MKLTSLSFNYIHISVRQKGVSPLDILRVWENIVYTLNILTIIVCLVKCMWCTKSNFCLEQMMFYIKQYTRPLSTVNNDIRNKIITHCYADVLTYYLITNAHVHCCICSNKHLNSRQVSVG
jgi:hypothetical protein